MTRSLFEKVPPDEMNQVCRDWFDWLTGAGIAVTAWRYLPTGSVTLVLDQAGRMTAQSFRHMADFNLMTAKTGIEQ